MEFNCRLEILDDTEAFYIGPAYEEDYYRGTQKVEGTVGGNDLMLRTVELFKEWVEKYDEHTGRAELEILGLYLYQIAFGTPHMAPESTVPSYPLKEAFKNTYEQFERQLAKEESRDEPKSRLRLMLVLHKEATRLALFPWEFLFMPLNDEGGTFLAGENTDLILTRFVPDTDPPRAFKPDSESKELRILIVLSAPEKLSIVDADDLISELLGLKSNNITVELFTRPTRRTLADKITKDRPHIIHFIGHGREGGLALHREEEDIQELTAEDTSRAAMGEPALPIEEYADWLDSNSVSDLFNDYRPRLVFLHACKGAASYLLPRSLQSFSSTARDLAYTIIPAVIAMQYEISNGDAQRFAQKFYRQLREGKNIDEAVVEARRELGRFSSKGRQAWSDRSFGTPLIYLQSEKPIIRPPVSEPEESATDETSPTVMQKVQCPYPNCNGLVIPGKRLCLTCRQPLMLCWNCKSVVAQLFGLCDNCGAQMETEKVGASAQSTPTTAPRPAVDAANIAPDQQLGFSAAPANPAQPAQPHGGYDVIGNGQQTGNE